MRGCHGFSRAFAELSKTSGAIGKRLSRSRGAFPALQHWVRMDTIVHRRPGVRAMKAEQIYEGFIGFEERSAGLYLDLSVRFADDPALRWFFVDMAMEEKQHAGMLQHCREAGVFAEELPGNEEVQRLDGLFKKMEQRIGAAGLTLDDAFDCAIKLESSEINDIYSKLTAPIEGPAHMMRKKMELSVAAHFGRLYEAARNFGASADIQMRLAKLLTSGRSPGEHA